MDNKLWVIEVIAVCAACTLFERALPFLFFRGKEVPKVIEYLGKVLPAAIICTLIVYCLRNITFSNLNSWLPQIVAAAVTVALHLWKRNTLLSIAGGTVCCMLLSQYIV